MTAGGSQPIIWPLLNKLSTPIAWQTKPKVAANQGLTRIPAAPWDEADRPGAPWFGQVEGSPRLWEFAPWGLGLCAVGMQSKRLVEFKTNPRALAVSEQRFDPAVIHPWGCGKCCRQPRRRAPTHRAAP